MASGIRGEVVVCALDDIDDPGARGFRLDGVPPFFVVRVGGTVRGYVNACPHRGTPLDWKPDTFLTVDRTLIQCSTHGAQFRIADGLCLAGPCAGASLAPVAVRVRDGAVVLDRP